jgi:hypothetical protein
LFCCDVLSTRGSNNCFAKLIYYDEHGVIVLHRGKVDDKIHCYGFPDAGGYLVRLQWYVCSGVYLGGLAGSTTVDIVVDKLRHSGPPEFSRDNFIGFPSFWMSCGDVVMVLFDNILLEVVILWNVDMPTVKDKSIFEVPVFQAFDN